PIGLHGLLLPRYSSLHADCSHLDAHQPPSALFADFIHGQGQEVRPALLERTPNAGVALSALFEKALQSVPRDTPPGQYRMILDHTGTALCGCKMLLCQEFERDDLLCRIGDRQERDALPLLPADHEGLED